MPEVIAPEQPAWAGSNWQSYCVRLSGSFEQRQVMQDMLDLGIATRPGIMCAHQEIAYEAQVWSCGRDREVCGCEPHACAQLHESETARATCILLPIFHEMTDAQQSRVVDALQQACRRTIDNPSTKSDSQQPQSA
jgi:dTDP-4-amino-4,6-dideoxygalactose transaminase